LTGFSRIHGKNESGNRGKGDVERKPETRADLHTRNRTSLPQAAREVRRARPRTADRSRDRLTSTPLHRGRRSAKSFFSRSHSSFSQGVKRSGVSAISASSSAGVTQRQAAISETFTCGSLVARPTYTQQSSCSEPCSPNSA